MLEIAQNAIPKDGGSEYFAGEACGNILILTHPYMTAIKCYFTSKASATEVIDKLRALLVVSFVFA